MVIESSNNPIIKELRKLQDKKWREKEKKFVFEGVKSVMDIPSYVDVEYFVVASSKQEKYESVVEGKKFYVITDKLYQDLSGTVTSSGLLAVVNYFDKPLRSPNGHSLILDGISDPGNLGTLIRTSVAMGITEIYLASCCDLFSPKVLRSTMGGIFRANLYRGTIKDILDVHAGSTLYAMDMSGKDLVTVKFNVKSTIIVGNEAHGLSNESKLRADEIVSLPTENTMESLNASVAGGIALYFLSRNK